VEVVVFPKKHLASASSQQPGQECCENPTIGGKKQTTSMWWRVGGFGELSPLNFKPHDVGQTSAHLFGCQHF